MSSDIKLNENHDIDISTGDLVLVSDSEYVLQNVRQSIKLSLGEAFLERTRGVPYIQQIFRKNPDPGIVNASFTRIILSVVGVLKLNYLKVDIDAKQRIMTVEFSVLTKYGSITDFLEI